MDNLKFGVPCLTQAKKDLKDVETQFESSEATCRNLFDSVDKLKLQKQTYLAAIQDCHKQSAYLRDCLREILVELQDVTVSINKAKVMDSSVSERIKYTEELLTKMKTSAAISDIKLEQKQKINKEHLLLTKQELQKTINNTSAKMKDALETLRCAGNVSFSDDDLNKELQSDK